MEHILILSSRYAKKMFIMGYFSKEILQFLRYFALSKSMKNARWKIIFYDKFS